MAEDLTLNNLRAEPGVFSSEWQVISPQGRRICYVYGCDESEAIQIARFIARACNSHKRFLETCKKAAEYINRTEEPVTNEGYFIYDSLVTAVEIAEEDTT